MSAWDIYWVMQLDSIGSTLIGIAVIGVLATLFLFAVAIDGDCSRLFPCATAAATIFVILANGLLPSSKTAAAMVILPAIANNEQIKQEAGDLYGLAKQALTNLAKSEEKSK